MDKQRGDAVVWLVALLVIVIIGAVGYVVWDKYLDKTPEQPVALEAAKPKLKEVCMPHEKLCFKVPEAWTADVQEKLYPANDSEMAKTMKDEDFAKTDAATLRSPDGLSVTVMTGITGVGGACDPQSVGKLWTVAHTDTTLGDYKIETDGSSAETVAETPFAVSLVTSDKDGKVFTPSIELTRSMPLKSVEEQTACSGYLSSLIPGKNVVLSAAMGGVGNGFVSVSTTAPFSTTQTTPPRSYSTVEEAKKALDSAEYKQAFDIIASAYYK